MRAAAAPDAGARSLIGYVALLCIGVGSFLVVARVGGHLTAPPPLPGPRFGESAGGARLDLLLDVLVSLLAIVGSTRLLGRVGRYLGQPAVVGEIVAGLLLGPSLLGRVAPGMSAWLFPAHVMPLVQVVAQIGVILFMFIVGVELDLELLRRRGRAAIAISHASIVVPFCLGALLALLLYPRLGTSDVPFTAFALFLGISMSVTAFPVLARILGERGLDKSTLGALALTCAAIDDASAWCLLAIIVGVVQSRISGALATAGLAVAYVAVLVFLVRPLLARVSAVIEREGQLSQNWFAVLLVVALSSALATDAIGIHALFGAFAVGVCVPSTSLLGRELRRRIEDVVMVLFLPAFFAFTGLRTQLGLLDDATAWGWCALIVFVACAGKLGGTAVAARAVGLSWRDSAALGVLMNTRGLMELVVLNIGLDLKVISPTLFTMLVLMAVLTTVVTSPLLGLGLVDARTEPAG